MTDNQNPLQALTNMKNPEGQPPATSGPSAEELVSQQQQEEAIAVEKKRVQAKIQELGRQKTAQDEEAIAQLREELPQVIKDNTSVEGVVEGDVNSIVNNQAEDKLPQVEQLRRLE